jgi:hypothetical protein
LARRTAAMRPSRTLASRRPIGGRSSLCRTFCALLRVEGRRGRTPWARSGRRLADEPGAFSRERRRGDDTREPGGMQALVSVEWMFEISRAIEGRADKEKVRG